MTTSPEELRRALRTFPSGVTVVTAAGGTDLHGMTASAFASVSLEPPLVMVSLDKASRTRALILDVGTFAVNILAASQEKLARFFAGSGDKPFDDLPHSAGRTGAPLLDGALAWLECRVSSVVEAGDHDVVLGEVLACSAFDGAPLVYHDQNYRSLKDN